MKAFSIFYLCFYLTGECSRKDIHRNMYLYNQIYTYTYIYKTCSIAIWGLIVFHLLLQLKSNLIL